jgi:hypothetical protein
MFTAPCSSVIEWGQRALYDEQSKANTGAEAAEMGR